MQGLGLMLMSKVAKSSFLILFSLIILLNFSYVFWGDSIILWIQNNTSRFRDIKIGRVKFQRPKDWLVLSTKMAKSSKKKMYGFLAVKSEIFLKEKEAFFVKVLNSTEKNMEITFISLLENETREYRKYMIKKTDNSYIMKLSDKINALVIKNKDSKLIVIPKAYIEILLKGDTKISELNKLEFVFL